MADNVPTTVLVILILLFFANYAKNCHKDSRDSSSVHPTAPHLYCFLLTFCTIDILTEILFFLIFTYSTTAT